MTTARMACYYQAVILLLLFRFNPKLASAFTSTTLFQKKFNPGATSNENNNLNLFSRYKKSSKLSMKTFPEEEEVKGGIRYFLTQRAIQSFMFLSEQNRDPHTVHWIEDFGGVRNLLKFHGTGAFNQTKHEDWASFLLDMVVQPKHQIIIEAPRRSPFGSGALGQGRRKNPYLQDRFVEYTITIDPASLVARITSVREQIASELAHDLPLIAVAGEVIINSYHEGVRRDRDDEESDRSSTDVDECRVPGEDNAYSLSEECIGADNKSKYQQKMLQFTNENAFNYRGSNPLRKGTYDLVGLLSLQEAIHRVLRDFKGTNSDAFEFLREFYYDRLDTYFDGDGKWNRDEIFLEELLGASPKVTANRYTQSGVSIVDPIAIAEKVIRERGLVVMEWKEIMMQVPEEHITLKKNVLIAQVETSVDTTTSIPKSSSNVYDATDGSFQ